MRKFGTRQLTIVPILAICGFAQLSSAATSEKSLNSVLERYVDSSGGRAEFQKLKSLRIVGRIDFKSGQTCSFVILKKKPDKVRITLDYGNYRVTQAYDGKTAWWMQEAGNKVEHFEMEGQRAQNFIREAPIANALVNRDIEGVEFSLGPEKTISGNSCFMIDVLFPDGWQSVHYISKETYREVRILQINAQGVVEYIIIPSRFELIDGILFSMRLNEMNDAEEITSTMVVETVETNLGLLNTAFVPQVEFEDSP